MYFYNFIIICTVPICFCQELKNENVINSKFRIKRAPEKGILEEIHKIIKDKNKVYIPSDSKAKDTSNISLPQKSKAKLPVQPKPREVLPIPQKPKEVLPIPQKPKEKVTNSHPPSIPIARQANNIVLNKKEAEKKPEPRLPNNNVKKPNSINTPNGVQRKQPLKPIAGTRTQDMVRKRVTLKPMKRLIEDSDDVNVTTKPEVTTQSENIDSQIEKPIAKQQDKAGSLVEDIEKHNHKHLEDFGAKIPTKHLLDEEKKSHHEGDASNNIKIISQPTKEPEKVQLEKPETKNSDDESESKPKDVSDSDDSNKENSKNDATDDSEVSDELCGDADNQKSSIPDQEKKDTTPKTDDVYRLSKPIVDSLKNKTIEVIEIKQRNFKEVVEKQPPPNDSNAPYYSSMTWQDYGTKTPKYQEEYRPEVTYAPQSYEYQNSNQYPNQYKVENCYYNPNYYNDNFQRRSNTDAKKTYRSWVNTEVVIRTSLGRPHDIQIQPVMTGQTPVENNYNNYAKGTYSSYPCYVYPSVCYGSNNGYYQ